MDDIIPKLKTPAECEQLALNVQQRNPELARRARRRAVELRAEGHGIKSLVLGKKHRDTSRFFTKRDRYLVAQKG